MQRVMEDTSYAASVELYLNEAKGDVWTVEMKDRDFKDIELLARVKDSGKKIAVGAVSHRTLQADKPDDVAAAIRTPLKHIPPGETDRLDRLRIRPPGLAIGEIAFFKASSIAQGCNIVRAELGLETSYVPAADPALQTDIVPPA